MVICVTIILIYNNSNIKIAMVICVTIILIYNNSNIKIAMVICVTNLKLTWQKSEHFSETAKKPFSLEQRKSRLSFIYSAV